MFEELTKLKHCSIPPNQQHKVAKVLMLCILGPLFGHHTLKSILSAYGVTSTNMYTIYNYLSYKDLNQISARIFSHFATEQLIVLGKQSNSSWSRACPTFVIDASIYKQFLEDKNCELFDIFFSGQTGKPEYGFKISLGGIAIHDTFYPLIFTISPKHVTDAEMASSMLLQMKSIVDQIATEHQLVYGTWYLSVDSGYSDNALLDTANSTGITPICVPKTSHIFKYENKSSNLKKLIDNEYLPKEAEHKKSQPNDAYTLRINVFYKALNKELILLIFRYQDSKKVSVIYSTDLSITSVTLRHHWFQRTYIEQFFRFSKHTLKAAQSTADNVDDFVKKICLNFMKTIFYLNLRNHCRKMYHYFKNWTFGKISSYAITKQVGFEWIEQLLKFEDAF